jgi:nicotinate-nucleotide adenylyltransferase|tara:strand:+ start:61813 stop:62439 length:627 start_codon:yes stop_codon:yes gene_type:complete
MTPSPTPSNDSRDAKRLGFFGGSFDPLHLGHIELAKVVVEKAQLEGLYFVPAARNPLKERGPIASGELRLEMIRAAVRGEPKLDVIDWELDQPLPSYTRRTVAHLRERFSGAALHWLIGADQLPTLDQWGEIELLVNEVTFIVVARPGSEQSLPNLAGLQATWIEAPTFNISSTMIRERLAVGLPIDNLVSLPVLNTLQNNPDLYSSS